MATTYSLKGTSFSSFQVGKSGITIHQGTDAPTGGNDGDLYVRRGSTVAFYQKFDGVWDAIGIAANEFNAVRSNIILNAFRVAVNGGISVQNMIDGVADEYEDETGIDTGTSTNEIYDSINDYYGNAFEGYPVSNRNASANVYSGSNEQFGPAFTMPAAGDIHAVRFNLTKTGSPTGNCVAKLYAATGTVGTDAVPTGAVLATSNTLDSATLTGTPTEYTFVFGAPYAATATDYVVLLEYTGGSLGNQINVSTDTSSPTHSGNVALTNTAGSGWTSSSAVDSIFSIITDTTLVSDAFTASAEPSDAYIVVWQEDVDGVTLNTDLTAEVSIDNGATWDAATLIEGASLLTGRILTGNVDVSTRTGTSMKYRIKTLNTKEQHIHGVGLQWG